MSIYYEVKEHLIIKDTVTHDNSISVFSHRLARFGGLVLEDCAKFIKLVAITDGEKREFSGDTMTKEFHDIMRAIGNAQSVEIIADYGYYRYGLSAICPDILDFADYLDEGIKEGGTEFLDGLFYSLYNNADCSDDAGAVVAYGEKNGTVYTGMIEEKSVDSLPEGDWIAPQSIVFCVEEPEKAEEIKSLLADAEKFCDCQECDNPFEEVEFYLDNIFLHNNDELVEFLGLYGEILKVIDREETYPLEFADFGNDDGRIASVKINADGTHEILLRSAE